MGGDDIGRITAESEEVSRFSGGRTLHQPWTVTALVNQAVVRLGSLSSDRGNDTMSVQNTTLVKVHVNRRGKVIA